jgi:hypothetical protein
MSGREVRMADRKIKDGKNAKQKNQSMDMDPGSCYNFGSWWLFLVESRTAEKIYRAC